jgi:hypothetical protein
LQTRRLPQSFKNLSLAFEQFIFFHNHIGI